MQSVDEEVTQVGTASSGARIGVADILTSIIVAFNLAVAQPVLDVLSKNAEFFVARGSPNLDIVMVAVGATILGPLAIAGIVLAVRAAHQRSGEIVHFGVLAILGGVFVLQLLKRIEINGFVLILVAVAIGAGFTVAYRRRERFRRIVRWLWPVSAVIAALFLLTGPVSRILQPESDVAGAAAVRVGKPAPIVMLVLDEFPIASIMDLEGNVDPRLYPSFARLARQGTWYRNTSPRHDFTDRSVPSILTGKQAANDKVPVLTDYPVNLFSLLGPRYDYHVVENVTNMCPRAACAAQQAAERAAEPSESLVRRWRATASDVRWISLHVLLPKDVAKRFPVIDEQWGDFGKKGAQAAPVRRGSTKKRPEIFRDFIARLEPSKRPTLHFMHAMLPHPPYSYVRGGKEYDAPGVGPGRAQGRSWNKDQWLANLTYQRSLEQVRYTDSLVGKMLEKLDAEKMFDDTLIVITSDHGASFDAKWGRRSFHPELAGGIGSVPLFVKLPKQQQGGIDDRPAELIDILPTIAQTIGMKARPDWEGHSLLDRDYEGRTDRKLLTQHDKLFPIAPEGSEKFDVVRAKYALFAAQRGSIDPFAMGPYKELVDTRPSGTGSSTARVCMQDPAAYASIDRRSPRFPALLVATVRGTGKGHTWFAVAMNGRIASVTRTFVEEGTTKFEAFIDPARVRSGSNTVRFFEVAGTPANPTLRAAAGSC